MESRGIKLIICIRESSIITFRAASALNTLEADLATVTNWHTTLKYASM